MIDPEQFDETKEPELLNTVLVFNILYKKYPETITEMSYYDLYLETKKHPEIKDTIELLDWKKFYTDRRVQAWYAQELNLSINTRIHKLTKKAGTDKSTATQQTLSALLKHVGEHADTPEDNKVYIYSHIPLTDTEEHIENVQTIETIPEEIRDAITVYTGNTTKKR